MSWRAQFGHLAHTIEAVFPGDEDLDELFGLGRPLRVKLGLDLTSASVTIGNEVPLRILGRFQALGHVPVLILGDFTTLIGDPSGRDKTRPVLTPEQVEANSATWLAQIGKILDIEKVEVHRNSEWFLDMSSADMLGLARQITVAQMLERDNFAKRYAGNTPIHLHELLYPLVQAHDSVAVRSDIELGGTDQTFNITIGRTIQRNAGLKPQVCIFNGLLEGVDGAKKMSKSLGNSIGIDTPPKDMFGLATRIPDELVAKYFRYATDVPREEAVAAMEANIWEAKKMMAGAIVARHYGAEVAGREREEFERVFAGKETPDEMPTHAVAAGSTLLDVLRQAFALSGGEAKRLVKQGAVTLDGQKLDDPHAAVAEGVLKAGKRRFARLVRG